MENFEYNKTMSRCPVMDKCIPQETMIRNVRLAAAYVPFQKLCGLFSPAKSLVLGTAFPELYSPYEPKKRYDGEEMHLEEEYYE